jgi:hypothetical protein
MHVPQPVEDDPDNAPVHDAIRECLAIVRAISLGELLSALPTSEFDSQRHQTAVTLLELLEGKLERAVRYREKHSSKRDTARTDELGRRF